MIELHDYNLKKDFGVREDRYDFLVSCHERTANEFYEDIQGNLILNPPSNMIFEITADNAEELALYEVIHNHDMEKARHLYYIASLLMIKSLSAEKASSLFYDGGPSDFGWLLFSNAKHLYPIFASIRTVGGDERAKMRANTVVDMNQMFLSALIQDWETFKVHYDRAYNKTFNNKSKAGQKLAESMTFDFDFYKGLMEEDTAQVEAALATYLANKKLMKSRQRHSIGIPTGEYFSYPAMYYAKLAWICGHEIEINHPMIVSELLPIDAPETFHNPYGFLYDPVLDNKEIELIDGIYRQENKV